MNLSPLRQFFFGVLGWTPLTVMREASLADLLDAWEGYAAHHNIKPRPSPISRQFLDEMLKKFG